MAAALLIDSIVWMYREGIQEFVRAWINIHWFLYHFFSMPVLVKSLFAPFHRLREKRAQGFDFEDIMSVLAVNILMRFVGALVRSIILLMGVVVEVIAFVVGAAFFLLFILALFAVPVAIVIGAYIIIT
jgi:hypothetical protein